MRLSLRLGVPRADDLQEMLTPREFTELWAAQTLEDRFARPDLMAAAEEPEEPTMSAEMAEARAKARYG